MNELHRQQRTAGQALGKIRSRSAALNSQATLKKMSKCSKKWRMRYSRKNAKLGA